MTRTFLLSFFLLSTAHLSAQLDSAYQTLFTLPGDYSYFTVDPLGQVYLVDERNTLIKLDKDGRELFRFYNNTLGNLSLVDAGNPLNVLLYYGEHQVVVLLDRTLAERARLDLRQTELRNAAAVARSLDDQLWVYDDWDYRLRKLSAEGKIVLQSDDLRMLLKQSTAPAAMQTDGERVYLLYPEAGVASFTNFGQFLAWSPLKETDWQWRTGQWLLGRDKGLYFYDPASGRVQFLSSFSPGISYWRADDSLYWLDGLGLHGAKKRPD